MTEIYACAVLVVTYHGMGSLFRRVWEGSFLIHLRLEMPDHALQPQSGTDLK